MSRAGKFDAEVTRQRMYVATEFLTRADLTPKQRTNARQVKAQALRQLQEHGEPIYKESGHDA